MSDTLTAYKIEADTADFNNDGIADLLVLKTVAQSNPQYYLYLVNEGRKTLEYVDGFDSLYTPTVDSEHKIITTYLRSGSQLRYAFYRINEKSELIDLHESFVANDEEQADSLYRKVMSGY